VSKVGLILISRFGKYSCLAWLFGGAVEYDGADVKEAELGWLLDGAVEEGTEGCLDGALVAAVADGALVVEVDVEVAVGMDPTFATLPGGFCAPAARCEGLRFFDESVTLDETEGTSIFTVAAIPAFIEAEAGASLCAEKFLNCICSGNNFCIALAFSSRGAGWGFTAIGGLPKGMYEGGFAAIGCFPKGMYEGGFIFITMPIFTFMPAFVFKPIPMPIFRFMFD
jgi:hypothetical protein